MQYKPLYDRVVVRPAEKEESINGILLHPGSQQASIQGEIIATGNGYLTESGDTNPLAVKVGDVVMYSRNAGTEIQLDGETLLIMKEEDILGILA